MDSTTYTEVACAVFSAAMAAAQFVAAVISLRAAWRIAKEQQKRADATEQQRMFDFRATMLALASEAASALEGAASELARGVPENVFTTVSPLWLKLERLDRAVTAVLPTMPAHAGLAIAAVALAEALSQESARTASLTSNLEQAIEWRLDGVMRAEDMLKAAL